MFIILILELIDIFWGFCIVDILVVEFMIVSLKVGGWREVVINEIRFMNFL